VGWLRHSGRVELVVIGGVRDIVDHTLLIESRQGDEVLETLWRR
jgi:hypothetical protein